MVHTKTLVDQQASVIETMTELKVGRYTGDLNVDYWDSGKWFVELRKYQVKIFFRQRKEQFCIKVLSDSVFFIVLNFFY